MTSNFAPEVAKHPQKQQFRECASLLFRSVSDAACCICAGVCVDDSSRQPVVADVSVQHESHTAATARPCGSRVQPSGRPRPALPPPAAVAPLPHRSDHPRRGGRVPGGCVPRPAVGPGQPTRLPRPPGVRAGRSPRQRVPTARPGARPTGLGAARLSAVRVAVSWRRVSAAGSAVQQRVVQRSRRPDGIASTTWNEPTRRTTSPAATGGRLCQPAV